ncbi:YigZ family protein [Janibacter alittae]|uniref:YigZ family protein n=1 Tax=Janibacter alittae TaxID=3115209 RepID=A0ABZ2MEX6_9MICO
MSPTSYRTIARDGEAEIEVKRSRFRCTLARVESQDAARAVVQRVRKEHWDARHHCSALVIGPGGELHRSFDDGEPSGSAGAPMLEVLRGREVSDVVAVVTRWFGGVLLGTGGLARAYGDAVRVALDSVDTMPRSLALEYELAVSHSEAGRIENDLRSRGVRILETTYATEVTLRLGVPADRAGALAPTVAELTAGSGRLVEVGSRWVDRPSGQP